MLHAHNNSLDGPLYRSHRVGKLKLGRPVAPGVHGPGALVQPPQAEADRWRALGLPDHHDGLREETDEVDRVPGAVDAVAAGDVHGADVGGMGVQGDVLVERDRAGVPGDRQEQERVHGGPVRRSLDLSLILFFAFDFGLVLSCF